MLVTVTNIPTPYRTAFFNVLQLELEKIGESLHVLYCAETEPDRHWQFKPEENIYDYTFLKGLHFEIGGVYPHINFGLVSKLKKLNPRWILLAGSWIAPATFSILARKSSLGAPVIFWSEGHADAQSRSGGLVEFMRRKTFESIDYFVVPNSRSAHYVQSYHFGAKTSFLPNTIDEEFFSKNIGDKAEIRKMLNIPSDKTVIILVSTLNANKSVLEFYEAFKKLKAENLYAVQIGQGPYYEELKARIARDDMGGRYRLAGQQERDAVRSYLAAADVFALPTKSDANPLSPIEAAFQRNALLLSSKAGNVGELIPSGGNGWVISEITEENILNALAEVAAADRGEIEQMGEESYKIVSENFTREKAAAGLIRFLEKIN